MAYPTYPVQSLPGWPKDEPRPSAKPTGPGYHVTVINKGVIGELSKLREEIEEAEDAERQGVKVMVLVELSDLYGAMQLYLKKHHPGTTMEDLAKMSHVTQRAFQNGRRT